MSSETAPTQVTMDLEMSTTGSTKNANRSDTTKLRIKNDNNMVKGASWSKRISKKLSKNFSITKVKKLSRKISKTISMKKTPRSFEQMQDDKKLEISDGEQQQQQGAGHDSYLGVNDTGPRKTLAEVTRTSSERWNKDKKCIAMVDRMRKFLFCLLCLCIFAAFVWTLVYGFQITMRYKDMDPTTEFLSKNSTTSTLVYDTVEYHGAESWGTCLRLNEFLLIYLSVQVVLTFFFSIYFGYNYLFWNGVLADPPYKEYAVLAANFVNFCLSIYGVILFHTVLDSCSVEMITYGQIYTIVITSLYGLYCCSIPGLFVAGFMMTAGYDSDDDNADIAIQQSGTICMMPIFAFFIASIGMIVYGFQISLRYIDIDPTTEFLSKNLTATTLVYGTVEYRGAESWTACVKVSEFVLVHLILRSIFICYCICKICMFMCAMCADDDSDDDDDEENSLCIMFRLFSIFGSALADIGMLIAGLVYFFDDNVVNYCSSEITKYFQIYAVINLGVYALVILRLCCIASMIDYDD